VSRWTEAKKGRRNKRRAARDANWIPDMVMDDLVTTQAAIATDLEAFDARIAERGWTFDEESDENFVSWFYEPSGTDAVEDELAPVTTIWMSAVEDAEIVHLLLVGTDEDHSLTPEEFFEHLDVIETFRFGDSAPQFN
jgi:hypothetical protein